MLAGEANTFLSCLELVLRQQRDFHIQAIVNTERILLNELKNQSLDVLVFDYLSISLCIVEILKRRRLPSEKILLLNVGTSANVIRRLLSQGLNNMLCYSAGVSEVIRAIETIAAKRRYMSASLKDILLDEPGVNGLEVAEPLAQLSTREWQTALAIAQGTSLEEIATRLSVSTKTIQTYRYRIYEKLNVHSDVQLTLLVQQGDQLVRLRGMQYP